MKPNLPPNTTTCRNLICSQIFGRDKGIFCFLANFRDGVEGCRVCLLYCLVPIFCIIFQNSDYAYYSIKIIFFKKNHNKEKYMATFNYTYEKLRHVDCYFNIAIHMLKRFEL